MQYFRKSDLANTYHVSIRAVTNWIDATKRGRLDLSLHEENGKMYVANTARNIATIEKMVSERRKYRTTKAHKIVVPSPMFYRIFTPEQVTDIILKLDVSREIPRQYNYFDEGAVFWDKYVQRLDNEETANMLNGTIGLIDLNLPYIDSLFRRNNEVKVVDIGAGNGFPAKHLLEHLLQLNVIKRYCAVDISPDLLTIAQRNITSWFGERIRFEGEIRDITHERFTDVLARESFKREGKTTTNLALFLGATLVNFDDPQEALRVIKHSLGRHDYLIHTTGIDNDGARRYFDFNSEPSISKLSPNHRMIFDLLGIDESFYDVESGFDVDKRMRFIRARLKISISIKFEEELGEWRVDLNKGDAILLWRAWHMTTAETLGQFDRAGFELVQASVTGDNQYLLSIHRVKRADLD